MNRKLENRSDVQKFQFDLFDQFSAKQDEETETLFECAEVLHETSVIEIITEQTKPDSQYPDIADKIQNHKTPPISGELSRYADIISESEMKREKKKRKYLFLTSLSFILVFFAAVALIVLQFYPE